MSANILTHRRDGMHRAGQRNTELAARRRGSEVSSRPVPRSIVERERDVSSRPTDNATVYRAVLRRRASRAR